MKTDSLLDDLWETFANLDRYNIKINPKKCSFEVPTGQLLGYLISERGIEGNPEKIQAIINMQPPKTLRHVQQLIDHLATLSPFISKLGKKALPFYRLLWKTDKFTWTEEAQAAFDDLKRRLSTSPDKDHAGDPMSFVPIFHSESTRINNLPITRRTSPEEEERIQQAT
jgi:hypothetical protein